MSDSPNCATMTDQEANVREKRLKRIWWPKWVEETGFKWKPSLPGESGFFSVKGRMTQEVDFCYFHVVETRATYEGYFMALRAPTDVNCIADLRYRPDWTTARQWINDDSEDYNADYSAEEHEERIKEFFARWTLFFRRGCWLSGTQIEVTGHEKAQWMQDFGAEEIRDWNLTF